MFLVIGRVAEGRARLATSTAANTARAIRGSRRGPPRPKIRQLRRAARHHRTHRSLSRPLPRTRALPAYHHGGKTDKTGLHRGPSAALAHGASAQPTMMINDTRRTPQAGARLQRAHKPMQQHLCQTEVEFLRRLPRRQPDSKTVSVRPVRPLWRRANATLQARTASDAAVHFGTKTAHFRRKWDLCAHSPCCAVRHRAETARRENVRFETDYGQAHTRRIRG